METQYPTPLLPDDTKLYVYWDDAIHRLTHSLNAHAPQGVISKAVKLLNKKLSHSHNALLCLRVNAKYPWEQEGAVILRTMYDASMQGLYILADPAEAESRAHLYLEYEIVERHKFIEFAKQGNAPGLKQIANSPLRSQAEPLLRKELDRVRSKYPRSDGKGLRNKWYAGKLEDLAKVVGFTEECQFFQKTLSGAVHSSPFWSGVGLDERLLIPMAYELTIRVVGKAALFFSVPISDDDRDLIAESMKHLLQHWVGEDTSTDPT